jgi:hypothetical protein
MADWRSTSLDRKESPPDAPSTQKCIDQPLISPKIRNQGQILFKLTARAVKKRVEPANTYIENLQSDDGKHGVAPNLVT